MMQSSEESDPGGVTAEVVVEVSEWSVVVSDLKLYVNEICSFVLKQVGHLERGSKIELAVLLTNDDELRRLNREFCNNDYSTNVLAFPEAPESQQTSVHSNINRAQRFLGNIAISYQRVLDESVVQAKGFREHFTHILVHGVLHLLGYDHIADADAELMESTEVAILAQMGIANPYVSEDA